MMIVSDCDSEWVTRYYGSFLKGWKLWIGKQFYYDSISLRMLSTNQIFEHSDGILSWWFLSRFSRSKFLLFVASNSSLIVRFRSLNLVLSRNLISLLFVVNFYVVLSIYIMRERFIEISKVSDFYFDSRFFFSSSTIPTFF